MLTWSWLCSGRGYALFHQICISSPQPTGSKEVSTYEHQTNMSSTTKTSQRAYLTEFNMRIITMSINGPQHIIDRPPYIFTYNLLLYIDLTIARELAMLIYNISKDIISYEPVPITMFRPL